MAAIQRRQWLDDLAHRRLETVKLRTLCGYIASTLQLEKGAENVMLAKSDYLTLGAGTENIGDPATVEEHAAAAAPPGPVDMAVPGRPMARVDAASLPDEPPSVRVGERDPNPPGGVAGGRPVPLEQLGRMLGGGPA